VGLERVVSKLMVDIVTKATNIEMPRCKFCGSMNIVRNGTRGGTQYWLCRNCGRGFVDNDALPKMKYPVKAIASAIYQYYAGLSLNEIRRHIDQQYNFLPSSSAIYAWVTRFTQPAIDEARKHRPKVGDTWVADETVLFIGGDKYWLIDIIDSDTRYLLATRLSRGRNKKDIALLLREAYIKAGKAPERILTDGWLAYPDAVDLVFGSKTKHTASTPFVEVDSTNVIERFQGTLKDRTKVMRGFKKPATAQHILEGWLVYYNYLRPHESLYVVKRQSPLGTVSQAGQRPPVLPIQTKAKPKPKRKRQKPRKAERHSEPNISLGRARL
jgi:putative transposase